MEPHVKVLGILFIVYGAFGLAVSLLMLLAFGGATGLVGLAAVDEPGTLLAMPVVGVIGSVIIGFTLLMAVPRIVAGFGLLGRRPWARILAVVLSALGLFNVPFGTVLGIYGLWVLLSRATASLFGIAPTATGDPLRVPPPTS
jgi:hypothetical protein